jgi:hypothetical protein
VSIDTLECVGGDVDAWRVDAVGEHRFHGGLHHDMVEHRIAGLSPLPTREERE